VNTFRSFKALAWLVASAPALVCIADAYADEAAANAAYAEHCASCHGADRLGAMGPALLPENLERLRRSAAEQVVAEGRLATQMPAFGAKLTREQIKQLVDYIYTPPASMPVWDMHEIAASRVTHNAASSLPDKPAFGADPLNLFVVVEAGDHHATILDGDRLEPLTRFATRFALHGGPKFSPDGRYVYFASRDGWISKYDIWNLKMVCEVRAGINTRNAAVSSDGRFVMVGNYLPHSLVVLDARDLALIKVAATGDARTHVMQLVDVYRARIIDVSPESLVIETTGTEDKIDSLLEVLRPYGVMEMVRTGRVAMARGTGTPDKAAPGSAPAATSAGGDDVSHGSV